MPESGEDVPLEVLESEIGETTDLSRLEPSIDSIWGASFVEESTDQRPVGESSDLEISASGVESSDLEISASGVESSAAVV